MVIKKWNLQNHIINKMISRYHEVKIIVFEFDGEPAMGSILPATYLIGWESGKSGSQKENHSTR